MNINANTIIGDIVKVNFKAAQVLEKNNIDFCCGGGISLMEACELSDIDMGTLIPELEAMMEVSDSDSKYIDALELDELADYIEKRHHTYVNDNLGFLQGKLERLCEVHGENHIELFEIKALFDGAAENLSSHMKKEEMVLFPYIRKMVSYDRGESQEKNLFGSVKDPILQMEGEHQTEGERFKKIAKLTDNYSCPPDGCNTFQVTYKTLQDFEKDLHHHIHLESNILFKKAIALESDLMLSHS